MDVTSHTPSTIDTSSKKRLYQLFRADSGSLIAQKIGRNDPCRCNSGKKAKNCCGTETKYFIPKQPAKSE